MKRATMDISEAAEHMGCSEFEVCYRAYEAVYGQPNKLVAENWLKLWVNFDTMPDEVVSFIRAYIELRPVQQARRPGA